jgi:hypothetical protein
VRFLDADMKPAIANVSDGEMTASAGHLADAR